MKVVMMDVAFAFACAMLLLSSSGGENLLRYVDVVDALVTTNNKYNSNYRQRLPLPQWQQQQQQHGGGGGGETTTTTLSSTTSWSSISSSNGGSLDQQEEQENDDKEDVDVEMKMITTTMLKDLSMMKRKNIKSKKKKKKRSSCRCPGDDETDGFMFMMEDVLDFDLEEVEEGGATSGWAEVDSKTKEEEKDADETRREVLFSTIGAVWATVTTTTSTTITTATVAAAAAGAAGKLTTQPAYATAGVDAKMEFPDIVGGMSDRANKQCLVESLGNRECLVYQEDSSKFLYQGADSTILLDRLRATFGALEQIPPYVETKQWTKVNGLLTGPMGQLSRTLTDIVKLHPQTQSKAQQIKNDVFAMGTATQQRQPSEILKYQQLTIQHLTEFIQQI